VITIEDAARLQIDHPHVIALEHRPPNVEGRRLTIRQLLRNSLRMAPIGSWSVRSAAAEALDMLQAMNTGHDGSNVRHPLQLRARSAVRLETMVMMASIDIPFEAVRAQIASAVNLIVHQARMPDGRRKVAQIAGWSATTRTARSYATSSCSAWARISGSSQRERVCPDLTRQGCLLRCPVNQDLFDPAKSRFVPRFGQHDAGRQGPFG